MPANRVNSDMTVWVSVWCGFLTVFKCWLWFFPGMTEMVRKVTLSRAVRTMQDLFPVEYNFYPRSWILPEEFPLFVTEVGFDSEQLTWCVLSPCHSSVFHSDQILKITLQVQRMTSFF